MTVISIDDNHMEKHCFHYRSIAGRLPAMLKKCFPVRIYNI